MGTAMIDMDSLVDSGNDPAPFFSAIWMSDVREPQMLIAHGSLQRTVGGTPQELGYIPSFSTGFGIGSSQMGMGYGLGSFFSIVDDHIAGGSLLVRPGHRVGVGAPALERLGISYPGPCGQLRGQYQYPRDCLSGVIAIGGPVGAVGTITVPDTPTGGGTRSGLAFEPNLIMAVHNYSGGFSSAGAAGWGACGPGPVQWGCGIAGNSFGGSYSRVRIFSDTDLINIFYDGALIIQLRITAFTADGFTYTFVRNNIPATVGASFGLSWTAFRFESEEIEVGHGTEGDAGITTSFAATPEGIYYASVGTTVTVLQGDVFASAGSGVSGASPMQRVTSFGMGTGSRYDIGVIRFETGNVATQNLGPTGAALSWSGGGSTRKFGYIAWGQSRVGGRDNCHDLQQIIRRR